MGLEGVRKLNLMSDGCGGQQKNAIFAGMLSHLVRAHPTIMEITHRFFESGNTQIECDSMHSTIEGKTRRIPIYSPDEWVAASARRVQNPSPTTSSKPPLP